MLLRLLWALFTPIVLLGSLPLGSLIDGNWEWWTTMQKEDIAVVVSATIVFVYVSLIFYFFTKVSVCGAVAGVS